MLPEILSVECVVDRRLEKSELVTRVVAITLHLESIDPSSILDHPSKSISQTDLPIFRCCLPILFEILEDLRSDDIFPDDTEARGGFCMFWFLEEFCYRM